MATAQQAEQIAEDNNSMRGDLERALEAIESDAPEAYTEETKADAEELQAGDLLDDETGEKAKAEAKAETEAEKILGEKSGAEDDDTSGVGDKSVSEGVEAGKGADAGLDKAPESWSPAAREGWKDLSEAVRTQVSKRETEINKALMDGSDHRKTGEKFTALAGQYAQVIAAEGATDPITGVTELLKTVATLRMGSPAQKAAKIAGFIKHYGIDINTLDGILSGQIGNQPTPAGNVDPNLEALISQRMQPVTDLLARMDQNTRQTNFESNQKAIAEVTAFKQANEFYTDVQDDMADMVELAAKRNITMPLQEAYDKACAMNPEISKVLGERANNDRLLGGKQTMEEKRNAASSIMGKQGAPASAEDLDMRGTIEAAYDAQSG